jgi:hypothetical protein
MSINRQDLSDDDANHMIVETLRNGSLSFSQIQGFTKIEAGALSIALAIMLKSGQIGCQQIDGLERYIRDHV